MVPAISLKACDCLTPFGRARETWAALCEDKRALEWVPVYPGSEDKVPLSLIRPLGEPEPGRWLDACLDLLKDTSGQPWGDTRHPVILTSSNFGIGQLYAYVVNGHSGALNAASPERTLQILTKAAGWGENCMILSNACVSAQLGLFLGARLIQHGQADRVLVFSFDFLSPFVTGGFHSLKILNDSFPHPYSCCESGSIGLGDGAAYAILGPAEADEWLLGPGVNANECYHMTGNDPSGDGFRQLFDSIAGTVDSKKIWIKGHGTGTLEAGRLESEAALASFPAAPLASWKGSLGHTLGSCGLVELAVALEAMQTGRIPGNSQTDEETLTPNVARQAFDGSDCDCVALVSSAFGGAHAAQILMRPVAELKSSVPQQPLCKYIHAVEVLDKVDKLSEETIREYRGNFSGLAARRMSSLPLMLGQVLRNAVINPEDELIFVSEFGGVQALEKFLESFPTASPIGFQNSTQPGPASLVLVAKRCPVRLFTPVVGLEAVANALRLALLSDDGHSHLIGGEERGTWLAKEDLAGESEFAFYLQLSDKPEGAMGSLRWMEGESNGQPATTESFAQMLRDRQNACLPTPAGGSIELLWS